MANHVDLNNNDISGKVTDENGNDAENIPIIVRHVEQDEIVVSRADGLKTDANGNYNISSDNVPNTYLPNESEAIEMLEIIAEFGDGSNPSQGESAYDSGGNARMYPIRYSLGATFPQIVDKFEDNDLAEYTNTANYDTTTNNAIEGTYALKLTGNDPESFMYSFPGDGLNRYFKKGHIASVYARAKEVGGDNSAAVIGFGMPSGDYDSGYAIANWNFASWRLFRFDGGSRTKIADSGNSTNDGEWYEYEIEWHDGTGSEPDGTINVTRYTIDQTDGSRISQGSTISAQDTTYSGEGVFFKNESGTADEITIADKYEVIGEV
jgi:hypothetical protein